MSRHSTSAIKTAAVGMALGTAIGITVACAVKPKKPSLRRKAEHAVQAVGAIMQSVSDFIM